MIERNRRGRPEEVRPGLERIRAAFAMSGHPETAFRTIHVAGTNGKGSTAAFIDAILRNLVSEPVGLYTSPHLISPEERIRVGGMKIPVDDLVRVLRRTALLSREIERDCGDPLSYFEEMTWAACDWFRKKSVSVVVMEAGLGGRWDATSACESAVSVITTVGIDHKEWLGGSLRKIAAEKAEIFRHGVPAVLGSLRNIPRSVVLGKAKDIGSPVWELGRDFLWEKRSGGRISMHLPGIDLPASRLAMAGEFQRDNSAIACAAAWRWASLKGKTADAFSQAALEALTCVRWPGRYSRIPGTRNAGAWADGAHNPEAARVLSRELMWRKAGRNPSKIIALWSMLNDKDIGGFLRELSAAIDGWVVFPMEHERAASPGSLSAACRRRGLSYRMAENFQAGWKTARRWAGQGGMVIVCGSLAAVGEAFRHRVGEIP